MPSWESTSILRHKAQDQISLIVPYRYTCLGIISTHSSCQSSPRTSTTTIVLSSCLTEYCNDSVIPGSLNQSYLDALLPKFGFEYYHIARKSTSSLSSSSLTILNHSCGKYSLRVTGASGFALVIRLVSILWSFLILTFLKNHIILQVLHGARAVFP